ncbi:MAG: inositol monophosphatase [Chitinophagales bacterium]
MQHDFLSTLHYACDSAGKYLKQHFGGFPEIAQKESHHSIVTAHDLAAEQILIESISRDFPDHAILSEEAGWIRKGADTIWVIDPLDGTSYYSRGIGNFSVSMAVIHQNNIIAGMVHLPMMDHFVYAEKGKGAFCNRKPIHTSLVATLEESIGSFGHRYIRLPEYEPRSRQLLQRARSIRGGGSCAMELALLAMGKIDFLITVNQSFWDYAAGALLVKEAGGHLVDLNGQPPIIAHHIDSRFDVVASNHPLRQQLSGL